jgi:alkylation response protein AidB-like acyl-CoA dehydrogenase
VVIAANALKGPRGISCFLVEPSMKGFSVGAHEKKMGLRGSSTVTLNFDDVEVPAANLLGPEGAGFKIAMRALDGGRIGIGSQALGVHVACLEASRKYAQDRQQFGKPHGRLPGHPVDAGRHGHRADAARLLVLRAAWLKDRRGQPFNDRGLDGQALRLGGRQPRA